MRATNHVLAGTIIGLTVREPVVALPLALLSHFALDALPHYGNPNHTNTAFKIILLGDMTLASLVLLVCVVMQPPHWLLAASCSVIAASPDLMWLPMWLRELKHLPAKPDNWLKRFHHRIQWAEKPYNWPYEIIWAAAMTYLIVRIT